MTNTNNDNNKSIVHNTNTINHLCIMMWCPPSPLCASNLSTSLLFNVSHLYATRVTDDITIRMEFFADRTYHAESTGTLYSSDRTPITHFNIKIHVFLDYVRNIKL